MADYTDLRGRIVYKRPIYWVDLDTYGENDEHIRENNWEDGCKALFFQAAAPTGWTKDTTGALDGRALRVVSGTGGVNGGGSQMIGSTITLAHVHSVSASGAHTHTEWHIHRLVQGANSGGYSSLFAPQANRINMVLDGDYIRQWKMHPSSLGITTLASQLYCTTQSGGSRVTGSGGNHDHGGSTDSILTDLNLAYVDMILCSKDVESGYTDLTDYFEYALDVGTEDDDYFDVFGENDNYNKNRLTPEGSVMMFCQAVAPTGWTKLVTQHDKAARIVIGSGGGSGGSTSPSALIPLKHGYYSVDSAGPHRVPASGSHSHDVPDHSHTLSQSDANLNIDPALVKQKYFSDTGGYIQRRDGAGVAATVLKGITDSSGIVAVVDPTASYWLVPDHGGPYSGAHAFTNSLTDVTLAYVNTIICQKDAYTFGVYTDLTAFFEEDNLAAWQDGEALAQNDQDIYEKLMPAGSVAFFYQAAAPTSWTKLETQDDKMVRIVNDGSGGTSGGSSLMSSGLTLAHQHSIYSHSHCHKVPSHSTSLLTGSIGAAGNLEANYWACAYYNALIAMYCYLSIAPKQGTTFTMYSADETSTDTHDHGGTLASALANVTLAYSDVLMCQKN